MSTFTHPATRSRRPAGSPAGGQFAPVSHAESDLDLLAGPTGVDLAGVPHAVAWMPAGQARAVDLVSVVRAGTPQHEDGLPASLTTAQVRAVLARHLPGLTRAELDTHLTYIETSAARWDEVEATDPDDLDPESLDPDTTWPVALSGARDDYLCEADAVAAWREALRDWWADHTHNAVRAAWSHSLQVRNPAGAEVGL